MRQTVRTPLSKTSHYTSRLIINGWQFVKRVHVCHSVDESYYQHSQTGWTAKQMHHGPSNAYMGLLVSDEKGKSQGLVWSIADLP